jgi:hypothetical protein
MNVLGRSWSCGWHQVQNGFSKWKISRKNKAIPFIKRRKSPKFSLSFYGQKIDCVEYVNCLGVMLDRRHYMTRPSGSYVRFAISLFPGAQLTAQSKLSWVQGSLLVGHDSCLSGVARSDSILTPEGTDVAEQNTAGRLERRTSSTNSECRHWKNHRRKASRTL